MKGISPYELRQLILSVGTRKSVRPLSPVEVGSLIQRALDAGETRIDVAERLHLIGTTMIGRFTRILSLPAQVQQLVGWGADSGTIPIESASQIARLKEPEEQISLAKVVLESRLSKSEISQVIQIRQRSGNPIEKCIESVLNQRPVIEKRHVIIGELQSEKLRESVRRTSQQERDNLLRSALEKHLPGFSSLGCKVGNGYFLLVGDDNFYDKVMALSGGFEICITDYLEREMTQ